MSIIVQPKEKRAFVSSTSDACGERMRCATCCARMSFFSSRNTARYEFSFWRYVCMSVMSSIRFALSKCFSTSETNSFDPHCGSLFHILSKVSVIPERTAANDPTAIRQVREEIVDDGK